MKQVSKLRKQLTIMGEIWDFWPVLETYDKAYNSTYISFYKPWLKGDIDKKKIILKGEFSKAKILWPLKIITRTHLILSTIRKFNPDIVVSHHDDANISTILPMLISRYILKKQTRFIAYIHAGTETYRTKEFLVSIIKFFISTAYRLFDNVVTVSKKNKENLEKEFNLSNVKSIYNPINVSKAIKSSKQIPEIIKKLRQNNKKKTIFLTLGRLTEQKGQWFLLRAFKRVLDNNHEAALIIVGEGELRKDLEDLVERLDISDSVFFVGKQGNVYSYMKNSDCFILTTIWESFGQVLVENLSMNKPTICTDCESGPREVLCPELKLNSKIKYPYFGKFGVLLKAMKRETIMKTLKERELSKDEKDISDILISFIRNKSLFSKYDDCKSRAKDFDVSVIKAEVESLAK